MEDRVNNKEKLTTQDIQNLISDSQQYKKLKTVTIFGLELDATSLVISIVAIILWVMIWYFFDIFKIVRYSEIFFTMYIILVIVNAINSATDVADVETERLQQATQQNFIQGGIAVFILAFVFLYNINLDDEDKTQIYIVLTICLIISSLSLIIINVKNNSKNIRLVRKVQQLLYNQGLILFLLAIFIIFMYKKTDMKQTDLNTNSEDKDTKDRRYLKT